MGDRARKEGMDGADLNDDMMTDPRIYAVETEIEIAGFGVADEGVGLGTLIVKKRTEGRKPMILACFERVDEDDYWEVRRPIHVVSCTDPDRVVGWVQRQSELVEHY